MLSIATAIIGFLGAFAPEIIKYFNAKRDQAHELEILKVQAEMQKEGHLEKMEEINANADIAESQALYQSAEIKMTGNKFFDGLIELINSLVRPVITYAFLIFYGAHKFEITKREFTEFDQATLTLVLSYWFGQRAARWVLGKSK